MKAPASSRKPYAGTTRSIVIAIDVGTTFSGVSYSILVPGEVPKIYGVTRFPGQEHVAGNSKIPSVMWYSPDGQLMAAGAEADEDSILEQAEQNNWLKVELFKLRLRPRTMHLEMNGMRLSNLPPGGDAVSVFGDYLGYLYRCTATFIKDTHANGAALWDAAVSGNRVEFVLSHPNSFEGAQQTKMRRAAIHGGLILDTDEGRSKIKFVTEGEASLHACVLSGLAADVISNPSHHGWVVADAGGGTLDISSYAITATTPLVLEEIAPPDCIFSGSIFVSRRAREFLKKKLSQSKYGSSTSVDHITKCFDQTTKRLFRDTKEGQYIRFGSLFDKDSSVDIHRGQLKLKGSEVAALFEPSIEAAMTAIKGQIDACGPGLIKSVWLVGGFAASPWLFNQLQERLAPYNVSVNRPDTQTSKAVADGAVGFYCDHFVSARVSRFMYGVEFLRTYDSKDPEHIARRQRLCELPSGPKLLPDAFDCILSRNIKVKETKMFTRKYCTELVNLSCLNMFEVEVWCYRGKEKTVPKWIFRDSPEWSTLCVVRADLSPLSGNAQPMQGKNGTTYWRIVFSIEINFGLTEFQARLKWTDANTKAVNFGPASIIFNERGRRVEEDDFEGSPLSEDDRYAPSTREHSHSPQAPGTPAPQSYATPSQRMSSIYATQSIVEGRSVRDSERELSRTPDGSYSRTPAVSGGSEQLAQALTSVWGQRASPIYAQTPATDYARSKNQSFSSHYHPGPPPGQAVDPGAQSSRSRMSSMYTSGRMTPSRLQTVDSQSIPPSASNRTSFNIYGPPASSTSPRDTVPPVSSPLAMGYPNPEPSSDAWNRYSKAPTESGDTLLDPPPAAPPSEERRLSEVLGASGTEVAPPNPEPPITPRSIGKLSKTKSKASSKIPTPAGIIRDVVEPVEVAPAEVPPLAEQQAAWENAIPEAEQVAQAPETETEPAQESAPAWGMAKGKKGLKAASKATSRVPAWENAIPEAEQAAPVPETETDPPQESASVWGMAKGKKGSKAASKATSRVPSPPPPAHTEPDPTAPQEAEDDFSWSSWDKKGSKGSNAASKIPTRSAAAPPEQPVPPEREPEAETGLGTKSAKKGKGASKASTLSAAPPQPQEPVVPNPDPEADFSWGTTTKKKGKGASKVSTPSAVPAPEESKAPDPDSHPDSIWETTSKKGKGSSKVAPQEADTTPATVLDPEPESAWGQKNKKGKAATPTDPIPPPVEADASAAQEPDDFAWGVTPKRGSKATSKAASQRGSLVPSTTATPKGVQQPDPLVVGSLAVPPSTEPAQQPETKAGGLFGSTFGKVRDSALGSIGWSGGGGWGFAATDNDKSKSSNVYDFGSYDNMEDPSNIDSTKPGASGGLFDFGSFGGGEEAGMQEVTTGPASDDPPGDAPQTQDGPSDVQATEANDDDWFGPSVKKTKNKKGKKGDQEKQNKEDEAKKKEEEEQKKREEEEQKRQAELLERVDGQGDKGSGGGAEEPAAPAQEQAPADEDWGFAVKKGKKGKKSKKA